MRRALILAAVLMAALPVNAQAETEGDELVRLPGQGEANPDSGPGHMKLGRLVPGGGLIASFDTNADGRISAAELAAGTKAAFAAADANGDGQLVAIEQQDWAASLPTRDDTLANPVRFDPNLDRVVTFQEFHAAIVQLAASYEDASGTIEIASLSAPEPRQERSDRRAPDYGLPPERNGSGN